MAYGTFALFHRHRAFNPREGVWMGWERKRGKLLDFNRLIRSAYDSFPVKVGDLSLLPQVRFVLTLDADTELPRGTAHRLIGAMAHPLNQAIVDPRENIVVAGYGILQPRVGISVQSASSRDWPASTPVKPVSTFTLALSPTFIRTSRAKASSPAKAFTRSKP